jgi:hypothetical protein
MVALGLLVAVPTMAMLARANMELVQKSRNEQILPYGSLQGRNARDGTDWAAASPALDGTAAQYVVLFGATGREQAAGVEFWNDVLQQTRESVPDIQFAALCTTEKCRHPGPGGSSVAILSSMDPLQMHALSLASRKGAALVYHGNVLQAVIQIHGDAKELARDISTAVSKTGNRK